MLKEAKYIISALLIAVEPLAVPYHEVDHAWSTKEHTAYYCATSTPHWNSAHAHDEEDGRHDSAWLNIPEAPITGSWFSHGHENLRHADNILIYNESTESGAQPTPCSSSMNSPSGQEISYHFSHRGTPPEECEQNTSSSGGDTSLLQVGHTE